MVIQLSKEVEDLLHRKAVLSGRPADELAADAINAMFGERLQPRRWPPPEVVGIANDADADERYGPRSNGQPWPKSIGMTSDGSVDAEEFEDWLAAEYEKDWREAERQSNR